MAYPNGFGINSVIAVKGDKGDPGLTGPSGPGMPWPVIDVTASPYNADKTGGTDCLAAVTAAMTAAGDGGWLYFPAGTYRTSGTFPLPAVNLSVFGVAGQTFITGTGAYAIFDTSTGSGIELNISGVTFQADAATPGVPAIYMKRQMRLTNVLTQGFAIGVLDTSTSRLFVSGGGFTNGTYGIQTNSVVDIRNASLTSNSSRGLQASGPGLVSGCAFQYCGTAHGSGGAGVYASGAVGLSVVGCTWLSNNYNDVWFDSNSYANDASASGATTIKDDNGGNVPSLVGAAVASASTIAPTYRAFHVTGTTTINTITPPTNVTSTASPLTIVAIFDAACAVGTSGNIIRANTFTAGQRAAFTYDPATSKWYF